LITRSRARALRSSRPSVSAGRPRPPPE
jgi:hypothetical protein